MFEIISSHLQLYFFRKNFNPNSPGAMKLLFMELSLIGPPNFLTLVNTNISVGHMICVLYLGSLGPPS